jgi:hypothetical protein
LGCGSRESLEFLDPAFKLIEPLDDRARQGEPQFIELGCRAGDIGRGAIREPRIGIGRR